ncbi:MAG: hypothetical protein ACRC4M_00765, partial [Mycoplasma sp.]
ISLRDFHNQLISLFVEKNDVKKFDITTYKQLISPIVFTETGLKDCNQVSNEIKKVYSHLLNQNLLPVYISLQGSQNYNLDYEKSDFDFKAFVINLDVKNQMNNFISTTQKYENNNQVDIKTFDKFPKIIEKMDPTDFEFLYSKCVLTTCETCDSFYYLVNQKSKMLNQGIKQHLKQLMLFIKLKTIELKKEKENYNPKFLSHIFRVYYQLKVLSKEINLSLPTLFFENDSFLEEDHYFIENQKVKDFILKIKTKEIIFTPEQLEKLLQDVNVFLKDMEKTINSIENQDFIDLTKWLSTIKDKEINLQKDFILKEYKQEKGVLYNENKLS